VSALGLGNCAGRDCRPRWRAFRFPPGHAADPQIRAGAALPRGRAFKLVSAIRGRCPAGRPRFPLWPHCCDAAGRPDGDVRCGHRAAQPMSMTATGVHGRSCPQPPRTSAAALTPGCVLRRPAAAASIARPYGRPPRQPGVQPTNAKRPHPIVTSDDHPGMALTSGRARSSDTDRPLERPLGRPQASASGHAERPGRSPGALSSIS
jgi:hypothetical protein